MQNQNQGLAYTTEQPILIDPIVYLEMKNNISIVEHLPEIIQTMSKKIDGLLLDGTPALHFSTYYRDVCRDNSTNAPTLNDQLFYKLILTDNGHPLSQDARINIIAKLRELDWTLKAVKHIGGAHVIRAEQTIENGKKINYTITVPLTTLPTYLLTFDGDQKYLININQNTILFKSKSVADRFFQSPAINKDPINTTDEKTDTTDTIINSTDTLTDSTDTVIDSTDDTIIESTDTQELINQTITTEDFQKQEESDESDTQSEDTPSKPGKQKNASKRRHKSKQKSAKINHDEQETPVAVNEIETPAIQEPSWIQTLTTPLLTLFSSKPRPRKRFVPITQDTSERYGPSPRLAFLSKIFSQSASTLHEIKAPMLGDDFFKTINLNTTNQTRTMQELKDKFNAYILLERRASIKNASEQAYIIAEARESHATGNDLNKHRILSLASWLGLGFIAYESNRHNWSENHPEMVYPSLGFIALSAVSSTAAYAYALQKRQIIDAKILIHAFKERIAYESPANQLSRVSICLLLLQEISKYTPTFKKLITDTSPLAKFLLNLTSFLHKERNQSISSLVSSDMIALSTVVVNTLFALLTLHGDKLFSMMNRNDVPEITFAILNEDEKSQKVNALLEDIQTNIIALEQTYKSNKNHKPSAETMNRIKTNVNEMLLIYALRDKTNATNHFSRFEAYLPELTAFVNEQMDTYIRSNRLDSVMECPLKSYLFDHAMECDHTMVLNSLDKLTRPKEPILSWDPVKLPSIQPATKTNRYGQSYTK